MTPQRRLEHRLQLADTVSFFGGRHLFKAGVDFERTQTVSGRLPQFFGGTFVFAQLPGNLLPLLGLPPRPAPLSAVEAMQLGLPVAYVQGYGQPEVSYAYHELSAFAQDEWRLSPRLTLRSGLRYQRQFWPARTHRVPDVGGATYVYDEPKDTNDFAPRLGLAFDPRGDGRSSLQAAYGLFYADHLSAASGVPAVLDGGEHVRVYNRSFPASIAAWRAPGHRLPEPATGAPSIPASRPPGPTRSRWAPRSTCCRRRSSS